VIWYSVETVLVVAVVLVVAIVKVSGEAAVKAAVPVSTGSMVLKLTWHDSELNIQLFAIF